MDTYRPKLGLALGGGAARGWAHIGVLQVLEEAGIIPDVVAGTSIGAVAGGCYIAGKLARLEKFARSLTRRRVFGYLDFNLTGTGIISGKRLFKTLDKHMQDFHIEDLDRRFTAIATEISAGHEVWLNRGRLVDAMCASYALPGIFKPVKIGGRWLIDGALVNPVPVSVCRAMGANIVIAVNLNYDTIGKGAIIHDHGSNISENDPEGIEDSQLKEKKGRGTAMHLLHRQFFGESDGAPGISRVMMDSFNIIQDRIARSRLAGDPPDVLVTPQLKGIGLFDFHKASEAISAGRYAAEKVLHDLKRTINIVAA